MKKTAIIQIYPLFIGGLLSMLELAMDIDARSFSDFKKRDTWISWLGPSAFIFSLWIINFADWILGGPIGKSLVQGFPEVPLGLSILGIPMLWLIWPGILLGKLWWRKSWLVREAPALQHCRLTQKGVLPIQVYLQTVAIILGLVWSTFGLFTW